MKTSFLFSSQELRDLTTPYPVLIRKALGKKNPETALALCEKLKNSQVRLHDFYAESCTVLWSWIGRQMGEEAMPAMFRHVFFHAARRQFFDAARADAPPHLAVKLLAGSWRAHSCFGAGQHPGRFTITEDDEKFTFHLTPCGSGLRLWRKGWYAPDAAGKLSESAHPWTYGRKQFPYYCMHCPFLNEILPFESAYGSILWPVDPPETPEDSCSWHVYKDRNRIPQTYYDRLGLQKKPVPPSRFFRSGRRYFSEQTLCEMARPVSDRIAEHIAAGRLSAAGRLCRAAQSEFLVLHDLYVNMLSATLTFIVKHKGEEGLGRALEQQFAACIANQFVNFADTLPARQKIIFIAQNVFAVDACGGAGRHGAGFFLRETDNEIVFYLSPCGSGGRLIRSGAFSSLPFFSRLREKTENRLIHAASRHMPLSEFVIEKTFPAMVNLFTQRKPSGQAKTNRSHAWSFHKSGVPCFCCQCGMTADKLQDRGLRIEPPENKRDACVWRLDKQFL